MLCKFHSVFIRQNKCLWLRHPGLFQLLNRPGKKPSLGQKLDYDQAHRKFSLEKGSLFNFFFLALHKNRVLRGEFPEAFSESTGTN